MPRPSGVSVAAPGVCLRSLKSEVFDERFEVAVAEQQLVGILQAKGSDEDVDRLSNRDTARAKQPVVVRRPNCSSGSHHGLHWEGRHRLAGRSMVGVATEALQHLGQDQITHKDRLGAEELVKTARRGIVRAVEVVDPDARVNDDHLSSRRISSRSPSQLSRPRNCLTSD